MQKDEAEAAAQEAEVNELKSAAEFELSKATPLLEEAVRVLRELQPADMVFLKNIGTPTPTMTVGMEVACHFFDCVPKKAAVGKSASDPGGYFETAKAMLLNEPKKFLERLKSYDREHIPDRVIKKVRPILEGEDFTIAKAEKAATALVGICKWATAMVSYHDLLKIVNPKRQKVKEMKEELEVVRAQLAEKRAYLKSIEEKIEALERKSREKTEFMQSLQTQIDSCNKKLERAGKIISGLEGEKSRWTDTVKDLNHNYSLLIGNCLIAAGMVAYAGPFTSAYRGELETSWRNKIKELKINFNESVTMKDFLEDPVQTKQWTAASLPNDNLSIENAIILFKARRWPLMIDPQNQANKFIKNLGKDESEAELGLEYYKMSDPHLMRQLELAIQFGKWVLVENVGEELDPSLEPILLKQVDKAGNLRLGEKTIQWSKTFKFFMTTTLPNPHYAPETSVKVTILNFAITPFGLEEQMLNLFISLELPELQKKKDMIVQQNAQSAKALREIEDKIL